MATFEVRRLLPHEFRSCANIWDMEAHPEDAERFRREFSSGNRVIFVCVLGDQFVGEGALVFEAFDADYTQPGKRIYLSHLIVREEFRRRGVADLLVRHIVDYAAWIGYPEISVGVDADNIPARNLYRKRGFDKIVFDGYDDQGEFIKLLKILPPRG